ncbi:Uncharacterised protein [Halioglobus japonicus]|nr:Uncharacterised protein [Halioglobus japonicus]
MGSTIKVTREPAFSEEQCNALFAAILVHDDIDLGAELPDTIHLEYSQQHFVDCYQICLQLWQTSVDRKFLGTVAEKLYWHHRLEPETVLAFKHMRAKFKHLRFAYMAFDKRHYYPREFHRIIRKMGNLQDAFKHEQIADIRRNAIFLRLLTMNFVYAFSTRKIRQFQPTTPEGFRDYVNKEIDFVRQGLLESKVSARNFHEMRKVISRQVALYDNLKIVYPSTYHDSISRYLSTINGLMGGVHDELVAEHFASGQDYESYAFDVPDTIRQLLTAWVEKYEKPV